MFSRSQQHSACCEPKTRGGLATPSTFYLTVTLVTGLRTTKEPKPFPSPLQGLLYGVTDELSKNKDPKDNKISSVMILVIPTA